MAMLLINFCLCNCFILFLTQAHARSLSPPFLGLSKTALLQIFRESTTLVRQNDKILLQIFLSLWFGNLLAAIQYSQRPQHYGIFSGPFEYHLFANAFCRSSLPRASTRQV